MVDGKKRKRELTQTENFQQTKDFSIGGNENFIKNKRLTLKKQLQYMQRCSVGWPFHVVQSDHQAFPRKFHKRFKSESLTLKESISVIVPTKLLAPYFTSFLCDQWEFQKEFHWEKEPDIKELLCVHLQSSWSVQELILHPKPKKNVHENDTQNHNTANYYILMNLLSYMSVCLCKYFTNSYPAFLSTKQIKTDIDKANFCVSDGIYWYWVTSTIS